MQCFIQAGRLAGESRSAAVAQRLGQKIPQQGDLEYLPARRRVDDVEGLVRNAVGIEQGQQPPRSDMALHLIGGLQADASPCQRCRQQRRPVVDTQARGHPYLLALAILANKLPALVLAPVAVQTLVASKIGRMARHAVAIEVIRCGAEAVVLGQQRTGNERLILRTQGTDGGVEPSSTRSTQRGVSCRSTSSLG